MTVSATVAVARVAAIDGTVVATTVAVTVPATVAVGRVAATDRAVVDVMIAATACLN